MTRENASASTVNAAAPIFRILAVNELYVISFSVLFPFLSGLPVSVAPYMLYALAGIVIF